MKLSKILTIIFLSIILWSCNNEKKSINDKLIISNRIGFIKIGEKYNTLSDMREIEMREVDLSGKRYKNNIKIWYGFKDSDFKVYAQRQKDGVSDIVKMIICKSKEYQTENGIKVGMTIQELREVYPNKNFELIGGINNEIGYYIPDDLALYNQYGFRMSHVILTLSTEERPDTIITSIIVETD